jgi:hypothetical protein
MQQNILMDYPPGIRPNDFQKILKITFRGKEKSLEADTAALNDPARTTKISASELGPVEWQTISVIVDIDFFDRVKIGSFQFV